MTRIKIDGKAHYTDGSLPAVGQPLPRHPLTDTQWNDVCLQDLGERCKLIEVFPTVLTPGVGEHLRRQLSAVHQHPRAMLVVISNDLPSSLVQWQLAERLRGAVVLSAFRSERFGQSCGLAIQNGRYRGLTARASLIIDGKGIVLHAHLVRELDATLQSIELTATSEAGITPGNSAVTVTSDTAVTV